MKQGDLVVRPSYGGDVLFRIEAMRQDAAVLKGIDYRLLADAPIADLTVVRNPSATGAARQVQLKVSESMRRMEQQAAARERRQPQAQLHAVADDAASVERFSVQSVQSNYFDRPGRVLHLDGDGNYMRKSMQLYTQMKVPAYGMHAHEGQMSELLYRLLPQIKPDVVVITGHDGVLKHRPQTEDSLNGYKNSQNFVNAVRVAREYMPGLDGLVIVAGACQSHFEALIEAGANFASSPGRILIHALDPVYVAIKASFTSIRETISLPDVINGTISGPDGVGGIETRGCLRIGTPRQKAAPFAVMGQGLM